MKIRNLVTTLPHLHNNFKRSLLSLLLHFIQASQFPILRSYYDHENHFAKYSFPRTDDCFPFPVQNIRRNCPISVSPVDRLASGRPSTTGRGKEGSFSVSVICIEITRKGIENALTRKGNLRRTKFAVRGYLCIDKSSRGKWKMERAPVAGEKRNVGEWVVDWG